MRLLSIYKTAERSVPPSKEEIAKMGKPALFEVCASLGAMTWASGWPDRGNDLVEEVMKGDFLFAVEGCLPSALGARVRLSNGTLTLTDGRFTESKEVIGGLAILRANSKEEASRAQRRAAFDNAGLAKPLNTLIDKVTKHAYQVTDEDIAAARASGLSEDQIFEMVVCAALGQASRQYDKALGALEAATEDG